MSKMSFNGSSHHNKRRRMDGMRNESFSVKRESRMHSPESVKLNPILLFNILKPLYPITVDVLHSICQPSGRVLRILIFEKDGLKALVEFDDLDSAVKAREALNGADIYAGCCTLQIDFAKCHRVSVPKNDSQSWDYTVTLFTNPPKQTIQESKRRLIDAQLDKLFSLTTISKSTSASMNALLATVKEVLDQLDELGQSHKNWDCILVYHITRILDHSTREKWEESLINTSGYPSFEQLIKFLKSRARSLEIKEEQRHQPQATPSKIKAVPQRKELLHNTSVRSTNISYRCDCCGEDHYIAVCPKYVNYSLEKRCSIVQKQQLCFNCLGRHNLRACRSKSTCRRCTGKHHTSIHGMEKERIH